MLAYSYELLIYFINVNPLTDDNIVSLITDFKNDPNPVYYHKIQQIFIIFSVKLSLILETKIR